MEIKHLALVSGAGGCGEEASIVIGHAVEPMGVIPRTFYSGTVPCRIWASAS